MSPKIRERRVAGDTGAEDGQKKWKRPNAERTSADDEEFHRHGYGRDGAHEDGQQAIVLEPGAHLHAARGDGVASKIGFAAPPGEPEEKHAAGERAKQGERRTENRLLRRLGGKQHQQRIHSGGNWNSS